MVDKPNLGSEPSVLRTQYATSRNLRARASIYRFQHPPIDLAQEVLRSTDWESAKVAIDVGCGSGFHLAGLTRRSSLAIGVDFSPGMAAESHTATDAPTLTGDAGALPFATATADRVLAAHMLYHCPDPDRAVAELRRVLRPGGVAVVVTNGDAHLAGLADLRDRATGLDVGMVFRNFSTSVGRPVLEAHFQHVALRMLRAELVLPDSAPVLAYIDSARGMLGGDHHDAAWATIRSAIRDELDAIVARDGAYRCDTEVGIFTCS